ncbi:MAG: YcxB family protein [Flavobacteriales bacterium]|nr:YcxB family protein [Flavobacteriales bacterium]
MEQPIILTNSRADLLALYHRRDVLSPWRHPGVRWYWNVLGGSIVVAALLTLFSYLFFSAAWLIVLATLLVLGTSALLIHSIIPVLKARYVVHRWATMAEKAGAGKLWLNDDGYILHFDGAEHHVRWGAVLRVSIHDDHLTITTNEDRIFMRSSMRPEEYEHLCTVLRSKVAVQED